VSVLVSFHRLAAAEFVAARRWYARRSPAAEARFRAVVQAAVQQIEVNPGGGRPSIGACRWVRLRRFPYLLHYEQTHRPRPRCMPSPTPAAGRGIGSGG